MKILVVWESGKSKVVEAQALPRVGDKICDNIHTPTVLSILMWPSDNFLKGTGLEGAGIEAVITVSQF